MTENPIQKLLREADEQDLRRQGQIARQVEIINRLMDEEYQEAIDDVLLDVNLAEKFISDNGLGAEWRAVRDAAASGK